MRKLQIAYLLALAPVLMGADDSAYLQSSLVVNTLPICADNEYLTYTSNGIACTTIMAGSLSVPDCKKDDQLLTYSMTGEIGVFSCTAKGSESLSSSDITTINTRYQELVNMETQIRNLESGMRSPAAKFCGVTTGTTVGKIQSGAAVGLAAAADLCSQVAACGTGARMCSVYDMYNSVASGTITGAQSITPRAWVFMGAWANSASGVEPTAGLADNCASYTYPTGNLFWQGTAVEWTGRNDTGDKVLKFHSGSGAPCNVARPIACCK